MSCIVGGQKQACLSSWVTSFGWVVACFACIVTTIRIHACTKSRCVVSCGLYGLWWTSLLLRLLSLHLRDEYPSLPNTKKCLECMLLGQGAAQANCPFSGCIGFSQHQTISHLFITRPVAGTCYAAFDKLCGLRQAMRGCISACGLSCQLVSGRHTI